MKLGVYQNEHNYSAIAVRVKDGKVTYLTTDPGDAIIYLRIHSVDRFLADWPKFHPGYPITRAARLFSSPPYTPTEGAAEVLRRLLEL